MMSIRGAARWALVIVGAGIAAAGQAVGQEDRFVPVRGWVLDTAGTPIREAEVVIYGTNRSVREARVVPVRGDGSFEMDSLPAGRYWLIARRLGYAPATHTVTLERGKPRRFRFLLEPAPQALAEITVEGRAAWERQYRDFVRRSRSAFGRFLTRDDIERFRPVFLGDMLRMHLPFTSSEAFFSPSFASWSRSPATLGWRYDRFREPDCPPAVSINGGPVSPGWAVNDFHPPDVEAIEVYRTARHTPLEFGLSTQRLCGPLVVVWLRTGH